MQGEMTHMPSNWIRREKRLAIYLRDGLKCTYCGKTIEEEGVLLTLDHLHVRCEKGSNSERNLVTACKDCNTKRGKLGLLKWLERFENGEKILETILSLTHKSLVPYRKMADKIIANRSPSHEWRNVNN